MQVFLVGGAVRDHLLNRPVHERDWVVVGARPEDLLKQGYQQVGKDFPVFLHPKTKEEYALARTERKSGAGHTGFICEFHPDIRLEDDLIRRDLTINAIAQNESGEITDPYGGQRDITLRLLRHISPAFAEDPLRLFRVARFAARYASLGFSIASETLSLMHNMVAEGQATELTPERVWKETQKALSEERPDVYFHILRRIGLLKIWFPEIDRLFGIPQRSDYHPEIDCGFHTIMSLSIACQLSQDPCVRFAALVHDLGKGDTPQDILPRHIGHEERGVIRVKQLSQRLRVPRDYQELGEIVSRYHLEAHRAETLKPATLLKKLLALDVLRRPDRFALFLLACEADARGRLGHHNKVYYQAQFWKEAAAAFKNINMQDILAQGLDGIALGQAINTARLRALTHFHQQWIKHRDTPQH